MICEECGRHTLGERCFVNKKQVCKICFADLKQRHRGMRKKELKL